MALQSRSRRSSRDDEPEETGRRSNRREADDRDDEPRGRGRHSSREEDDSDDAREGSRGRRSGSRDEAEPRGRGRRDRDDNGDGDDAPRGRGRSGRASSRDDEGDDAPRRGRGRRSDSDDEPKRDRKRGKAARGFGSYKEKRVSGSSNFAEEFKPSQVKGSTLIKFAEDGPFDTYLQHWIEEFRGKGKMSFVCHDDEYFEDYDDGCPLDDIGDNPKTVTLFNVIDFTNPRKPEVKIWAPGVTVADQIERLSEASKTSPINRDDLYFEVESVQKGKKWNTTIQPVKARDLEEDFKVEPLTEDEIDAFMDDLYEDRSDHTQVETYDELREIADELR